MKNEREDGYAEGAKAQAIETARRMKAKGIDVATIAELTGLTPDEISKI
jgi:predicted transposase/invertase (TIGR01784 family)